MVIIAIRALSTGFLVCNATASSAWYRLLLPPLLFHSRPAAQHDALALLCFAFLCFALLCNAMAGHCGWQDLPFQWSHHQPLLAHDVCPGV